jgi:hypothetical protein
MNNGMKIGLLAVIAILLGAIAYNMYSNSDEDQVFKPIDVNAKAAVSQIDRKETGKPEKYDPARDVAKKEASKQAPSKSSMLAPSTIEFVEYEWDFGTMDEGDRVEHIFKFKNTGTEPLILEKCKGSCGCTVPECPKEPILPGAEGEIKVAFNSKGKKNSQTKRVTVTSNTDPEQTILTIKAQVTPAAE